MPQPRSASLGPRAYVLSLAALALLPIAPELYLFFRNHEDLKYFGPIAYYEGIVSFLLLAPALVGHEVADRIGLDTKMQSVIGRGPSSGQPIAKAAIDMALTFFGRALGAP